VVADIAGRVDGLVGENGHQGFGPDGVDGFERREDAGVDVSEVQLVDAVVVEKVGQNFGDVFFVVDVAFGIAEGAADEHGGSVADVAGDDGVGKRRLVEVCESGVDGVAEIDAGVDEGAVEIEDDEPGARGHFLTIIDGAGVSSVRTEGGSAMSELETGGWTRRKFMTAVAATGVAGSAMMHGVAAEAQNPVDADEAIKELMAGNARFVAGKLTSFDLDLKILKAGTVEKQEPFAAILSCADSRVPVELVFDQSIGHLFVARVAGNMLTPEIIGSLEYGVAVLGIKAIMVLGHAKCGAVSAAMKGQEVPGQISVLYQHMMPAIKDAHEDVAAAVKANALFQAQLLRESSTVIAKAMKDDGVKVVAGYYDLATGKVQPL
jgi:carbonic anhydrase